MITDKELLAIASGRIGRRRTIDQAEMASILSLARDAGLDLTNDWVFDGHAPADWARACKGICCISVSAPPSDHGESGRWHGSIRYDAPGQMSPAHHATLMFVPASVAHQADYLADHADRVLIVEPTGLAAPVAV